MNFELSVRAALPSGFDQALVAASLLAKLDRRGTTIYGGTSEIHRSMIAERAVNLPRTRA
jgi:3-oxochol-4-en-24-oyl-CoA dehydrogenase